MRDNFQVETFDDKEKRDARYQELKAKKRAGLVKLSVGEWITVSELRNFPARVPIGKKGPSCGFVVHQTNVDITVPTWAIAYPEKLPPKRRKWGRRFPTGPSPKRRRRIERFRKRHPLAYAAQHAATGGRGIRANSSPGI